MAASENYRLGTNPWGIWVGEFASVSEPICHLRRTRKNLAANKGILEAKGVGVRQVTSKELEQEHHCHACPARMDATLVCLPECLLVTHFPDRKPQSLHAVLRKAFMAFAGLDQGEVINHEAEDVHHDFFPLQDHPALNSPCNPHPLGGHYCRARTTCPAGLFGLNDIDHGGRQVWADTRYGIAGGEHERVHAETFTLVPQPHKQHIPAYRHTTRPTSTTTISSWAPTRPSTSTRRTQQQLLFLPPPPMLQDGH
uniref:Uncharacterized protein n=1 Tax=Oryza glumipatula TaxID=40148 RepID=A0A0D9YAR6_9ORYZ